MDTSAKQQKIKMDALCELTTKISQILIQVMQHVGTLQLLKVPWLEETRFSMLLNFEHVLNEFKLVCGIWLNLQNTLFFCHLSYNIISGVIISDYLWY